MLKPTATPSTSNRKRSKAPPESSADKITVEVLSEGKKGILGFGAQKARMRAAAHEFAIDLRLCAATVRSGAREPLVAERR